jgi:hypothetical protein
MPAMWYVAADTGSGSGYEVEGAVEESVGGGWKVYATGLVVAFDMSTE